MRTYRWPALDHLLVMTDDVGVVQHATFDVPNRSCGYCTDDAGRGLIVACDAAARADSEADGARLVTTYLAYLHDAQLPDGWFHNFMGYDRRWQDREGSPDAVGRAIWGLGYAECHAPRDTWRAVAGTMRRRALDAVRRMTYVRSRAYAALGLVHALAAKPADEPAVRAVLDESLAMIADAFDAHAGPGWQWCEDVMTYDNARLCEALLRGGTALANERYVRIGLAMLSFYSAAVIEDDPLTGAAVFVPVGNDGWYPRGRQKSRRGQQPLEAAALVDAAFAALDITGDERWRSVAETAHDWYFGHNTGRIAVATETGCRDGLDHSGVNANMGAESTICYLMSAIALANRSTTMLRLAL
ncbi:MAG: glycosyltransferase, group [Candidatus Eremiobacteraeota bacterium]|nr:glycosyltransferase, group [Candidatus Eremiobacteraeota bacterium]